MTRRLDLCADDFGLVAAALDTVIAALAGRGRLCSLSRASPTAPHWAACAPLLAPLAERASSLGLHFNLTEGAPLSARAGAALAAPARAAAADRRGASAAPAAARRSRAELHAQLAAFVDGDRRGRPQFIDGHQHVHHLPGVRDIVLDSVAALAAAAGACATPAACSGRASASSAG